MASNDCPCAVAGCDSPAGWRVGYTPRVRYTPRRFVVQPDPHPENGRGFCRSHAAQELALLSARHQ
jgi:hypothetical protein